ncbi:endoglucanase [Thermanaerovibrio velox DSM 12556]|uniref:Endoglucanase n=1 Tax=Thermanaerovibrio velox DSM 12556 TaxID=926567 RepID=H0UR47_9BACT|nr:cellulase family glycosylhydrolase [Thermanaerovibrio velox]EHM10884.1 endoglucanase [Thermanaerovibrio velox DSM 12556]
MGMAFRDRGWWLMPLRFVRMSWILCFLGFLLWLPGGVLCGVAWGEDKISFWDVQRKGTNFFNHEPTEEWFDAAKALGVDWVRLAYDKWDGEGRDFLLKDADRYGGLSRRDLEKLKRVLGWAHERGMKVVIAPLTLPGSRWAQNNRGKRDVRLWRDRAYWAQAEAFWRDLAMELKGNPAVVGYNIINEPVPEFRTGLQETASVEEYRAWYRKHRGTAADLFEFYRGVIAAIREVDKDTPIMVDSGWFARPDAFTYWPAGLEDRKVLYAVHMYEPYEFTSHRNFKERRGFSYPGEVPYGGGIERWDRGRIQEYFAPFLRWAGDNRIAPNRIVVAEFGCYRRNPGAERYFKDLISLMNRWKVHWAFYAFREDRWDGMDYEIGPGGLGEAYWKAVEKGLKPNPPRRDNRIFDVIRGEFRRN